MNQALGRSFPAFLRARSRWTAGRKSSAPSKKTPVWSLTYFQPPAMWRFMRRGTSRDMASAATRGEASLRFGRKKNSDSSMVSVKSLCSTDGRRHDKRLCRQIGCSSECHAGDGEDEEPGGGWGGGGEDRPGAPSHSRYRAEGQGRGHRSLLLRSSTMPESISGLRSSSLSLLIPAFPLLPCGGREGGGGGAARSAFLSSFPPPRFPEASNQAGQAKGEPHCFEVPLLPDKHRLHACSSSLLDAVLCKCPVAVEIIPVPGLRTALVEGRAASATWSL